jgi:hypothetical protein
MKKRLKTLALYLPQFHCVPENDEWWGEGFTDWVAAKKAEPLFPGHYQPREPLDDNYYDLLQKETMQWQADLAKQYGVDGFCFYHYYFDNGRRILEKPAENLLKWSDVDMPFCFYWANKSWVRSWSNLENSDTWFETGAEQMQALLPAVLLKQSYGLQGDWKKHFMTLLPYFKDKRYIKKDGMPIFMILKPEHIAHLNQMLRFWQKLAKNNGFPGLFVIGSETAQIKNKMLQARMVHEPSSYWSNIDYSMPLENRRFPFKDVWRHLLCARYDRREKTYLCGITDFDDTPRRGIKGSSCAGSTPKHFFHYFLLACLKSLARGNEYIFINAWNEWGEGMYLEPDKKYGYAYLEAVRRAMTILGQFKKD